MFSTVIFEHSIPAWVIVLCLTAALGITGYAFKHYLGFTKLHTGLLTLRGLCLLLLGWSLLLPAQRHIRIEQMNPDFVVALDTSSSMSHSPPDVDSKTRFGKAQKILNADFLEILGAKFNLDFVSFDSTFQSNLGWEEIKSKKADGESTHLRDSLQRISERYRGRRLAGMLLLSDGLDTRARDDAWSARNWRFPIYTVELEEEGLWKETPELQVKSLETVTRVQPGWESDFTAVIGGKGLDQEAVNVHFYRDDELIDQAPALLPEGGGETEVSFRVQHETPGTYLYKVVVPKLPDEVNTLNKSRAVNVAVIATGNRVLYLEGSPRWESRYLTRLLEQTENVAPSAYLRYAGDNFLAVGGDGTGRALSLTDDLLTTFAIVIVGDVEAATLNNGRGERLVEFVENGGSLVLLGGKTAWGENGFAGTALQRIMPVESARGKPPMEGTFPLELASQGRAHPVFGSGQQDWRDLPPVLSIFPVDEIAPGALVLLETQTPEGTYPVAVAQRHGEGRVVSLLTSSLWRWQMNPTEGTPYKRFWTQMIEWLLPEESKLDEFEFELFADKEQFYSGSDVTLKARLRGREEPDTNAQNVVCRLQTPGGRDLELAMQSRDVVATDGETFPGFALTYSPTEAGTYKAVASREVEGEEVESPPYYFVVQQYTPEKEPRPFDFELMRALATHSGGEFLKPEQINNNFVDINVERQEERYVEYASLWNRLPLLAAIIVLLCVEWMIRKRKMTI